MDISVATFNAMNCLIFMERDSAPVSVQEGKGRNTLAPGTPALKP